MQKPLPTAATITATPIPTRLSTHNEVRDEALSIEPPENMQTRAATSSFTDSSLRPPWNIGKRWTAAASDEELSVSIKVERRPTTKPATTRIMPVRTWLQPCTTASRN